MKPVSHRGSNPQPTPNVVKITAEYVTFAGNTIVRSRMISWEDFAYCKVEPHPTIAVDFLQDVADVFGEGRHQDTLD